jgi:hypothetical protein
MTTLSKIHLIFKTHLDVGFTDYARNVVAQYYERDIPQAIRLATQLREDGSQERFVWTTGSWLIYEYLEQAGSENRRWLERAIDAGDITWHGLPFTTHCELMDEDLFRFGLSLSQQLDQRFGRKTISAKMTDVPGHTRAIVPLLAEAGIKFLHIGVNPGSKPPDVPPVFVWRSPDGSDVMVMYHKGTYGDLMAVDGLDEAIAFAHTGDNLGPQSPEQIRDVFNHMRSRFPSASIIASTMDAFAARLISVKDRLPILTNEIGDTWIHGVGSDPLKVSQFRELLRLRKIWLSTGRLRSDSEPAQQFHRFMLLVPEHTWGMDLKTHLLDYDAYNREAFDAARSQENFRHFEASWHEQRAYIQSAVSALPSSVREEAERHLRSLTPAPPEITRMTEVSDRSTRRQTAHFEIGFDAVSGAINHLKLHSNGAVLSGPTNLLGLFSYQTFSAEDYERFFLKYNINHKKNWIWVLPDFTKPGLEDSDADSLQFNPLLDGLYHQQEEGVEKFVARLSMPAEAHQKYGCPREVFLEYQFPYGSPDIFVHLKWFAKPANRMPEALWFSFNPRVRAPKKWLLNKMGENISPLEVIRNGNRKLHAIDSGVYYEDNHLRICMQSCDSPLIAPGEKSLLDFNNRQPGLRNGFHFCLYNNIWGTNFPMWYDDDGFFRFNLHIHTK